MPFAPVRRLGLSAAVALVVAATAPSASAQTTYTWSSDGSDLKWSTATNWSSGTVPNAPSAAALFNGSAYSVVEVDAAFTLGRLTFNPVGSVQTFYYLYPTGSGQLTFDNGTNPGVIESLPGSGGGLLNVILSTPIVIGGTSKTLQINNGSVAPVSVAGPISGT